MHTSFRRHHVLCTAVTRPSTQSPLSLAHHFSFAPGWSIGSSQFAALLEALPFYGKLRFFFFFSPSLSCSVCYCNVLIEAAGIGVADAHVMR